MSFLHFTAEKNTLQNTLQKSLQSGIWQGGKAVLHHWFELNHEGAERLPNPPYILASNHVSHLDGPVIIAAHGKHLAGIHSLAAQDYFFNHRLKGWIFQWLFNMVPFKRRESFRDCLPRCHEILARKHVILMFPEGTRSQTGQLQPFKSGLGFLSLALKVPIVPVYIRGTYQALPKGRSAMPRRQPIHVSFGDSISPGPYQHQLQTGCHRRDVYKSLVGDVRSAIENLQLQQKGPLEDSPEDSPENSPENSSKR